VLTVALLIFAIATIVLSVIQFTSGGSSSSHGSQPTGVPASHWKHNQSSNRLAEPGGREGAR
jgi:hypothetical protein